MTTERRGLPEVDFELETFQLHLLLKGPKIDAYDEATTKRIVGEHIARNVALHAQGDLKLAGAVTGHESIVGLGLFQKGSVEEVRRMSEEDPGVEAGMYRVEVVEFTCRKGVVAFPDLPS
jgi:uncharacterized protein YciI